MKTASRPDIQVIVHGSGRGRSVPTSVEFLSQLRKRDPELFERIRIHETGSGPVNLDNTSLVMFWLADPLQVKYPACFRDAMKVQKAADRAGIPTLNPPAALNNTEKTVQSEIWAKAGIPSQIVHGVFEPGQLDSALSTTQWPCIVRSSIGHSQDDTFIATTRRKAESFARDKTDPLAIIPLVDVRQEYRAIGDNTLFSRFHHKARAIVAGDQVMPLHLFFSKSPIVCERSSLFAREDRPRRQRARRYGFRTRMLDLLIELDTEYFNNPVAHAETLHRAVRVLGLHFAAIDYSIRPDGRVILWEANPFFCLPNGRRSVMAPQRQAVKRVEQTYARMVEALSTAVTELDLRNTQQVA